MFLFFLGGEGAAHDLLPTSTTPFHLFFFIAIAFFLLGWVYILTPLVVFFLLSTCGCPPAPPSQLTWINSPQNTLDRTPDIPGNLKKKNKKKQKAASEGPLRACGIFSRAIPSQANSHLDGLLNNYSMASKSLSACWNPGGSLVGKSTRPHLNPLHWLLCHMGLY